MKVGRKPSFTKEQEKQVIKYSVQGYSIRDVADLLSLSKTCVGRIVKRAKDEGEIVSASGK